MHHGGHHETLLFLHQLRRIPRRYAAVLWTKPDAYDYIDVKGLSLVRRDSCKLVKRLCKNALDTLLHERDLGKAVGDVRAALLALASGEVPMEDLVVSKQLKTDYKTTSHPHLHVAKTMRKRQPGSEPRSGDRVPFVFVVTADPLVNNFEKAEDPAYAAEQGLPLDVLYYIEHHLTNPLVSLFAPILHPDLDEGAAERATKTDLFGDEALQARLARFKADAKARVVEAKRVLKNRTNRQAEISSFFAKKQKVDTVFNG